MRMREGRGEGMHLGLWLGVLGVGEGILLLRKSFHGWKEGKTGGMMGEGRKGRKEGRKEGVAAMIRGRKGREGREGRKSWDSSLGGIRTLGFRVEAVFSLPSLYVSLSPSPLSLPPPGRNSQPCTKCPSWDTV
jgi:hypothetical protein